MEENASNNSSNITIILSSNGNDKEAWENLLCDINSDETNISNDVIAILNKNLKDKTNVEITLDILDFLVNYGTPNIVELIAKKEFLKCILDLLKNSSKSSVNVQKKIIFLTQKWANKYENEKNLNVSCFIENYNSLKKGGIIFPPQTFKLETYSKYISDEEAQCSQIKASAIKKIKDDNKKSIKESTTQSRFANPFLSEAEELTELANKKIYNNESSYNSNMKINNDENEENPYSENNNNINNINNDNNINNGNKINNDNKEDNDIDINDKENNINIEINLNNENNKDNENNIDNINNEKNINENEQNINNDNNTNNENNLNNNKNIDINNDQNEPINNNINQNEKLNNININGNDHIDQNNNNFNDNDNDIYPLGHPKNKNKNFNQQQNGQNSRYPKFPSQFGNNMVNNLKNNNNITSNNNINNDNNMDNNVKYRNRFKTAGNLKNNKNNQFPNMNNNFYPQMSPFP